MAMNLRGIRESGAFFAVPTYAFMAAVIGMCFYGFVRLAQDTLPDVESADLRIIADPSYDGALSTIGAAVPAGPGVLLRVCGADRRRGDQQRRPGLPAAQEQERRHDAAPARPDRDHDDGQRHRPGPPDGPEVRRPGRPRPAHLRRRHAGARRLRAERRDRPDRQGGVQRLLAGLLPRRRRHRRDPGAGGQHGLQRLPGARARSWPRTGSPRGRSARAATAWPTPTASCSSPSWRSCSSSSSTPRRPG